jgi:hypothetical protein
MHNNPAALLHTRLALALACLWPKLQEYLIFNKFIFNYQSIVYVCFQPLNHKIRNL